MQIANVAIRLLLPRMLSLLPRERARQPVETLVEAIARRRTSRLDVPVAVTHLLQAKLVRHLRILFETDQLATSDQWRLNHTFTFTTESEQTEEQKANARAGGSESEGDLGSGHRLRKILLVGEDEHNRVPELILVQHAVQLLLGVIDTVAIVRVHHEDQALRRSCVKSLSL